MPVISIRASDEWLAMVDAEAEKHLWSRNAAIVNLLWRMLGDKPTTKELPPAHTLKAEEVMFTRTPFQARPGTRPGHAESCRCYICHPPK